MHWAVIFLAALCCQGSSACAGRHEASEASSHEAGLGRMSRHAPDPETIWATTPLDHFAFDDSRSFRQKMLVYRRFWRGHAGPLLVYFGNEGKIEDFYNNSGFLFEVAPQLGAMVVFVEHRFYGASLPFGEGSYKVENLRYLVIEQALADMALILSNKYANFGCSACPAILFGGSYGGMLAAWSRLKHPHLSIGAIASSAPVDLYPGQGKEAKFWAATLDVYGKYASRKCANSLVSLLGELADAPVDGAGLSHVFKAMNLCRVPSSKLDIEKLLLYVKGALATMAMVDYPFPSDLVSPVPGDPVRVACSRVDPNDLATLGHAINVFLNWTGKLPCHNIEPELLSGPRFRNTLLSSSRRRLTGSGLGDIWAPWNYQACTELILEPLTSEGLGFFVEPEEDIPKVLDACRDRFPGIVSRIHWMRQNFGDGQQLVKSCRNVVFTDGDKDPWKVGSVPANASAISDGSVVYLLIEGAAHHQDLRFAHPKDPRSVIEARHLELDHIKKWIRESTW